MSNVVLGSPAPVFLNPNQQAIHSNATIIASGLEVLTGYGASEITLFINVKASPTGTLPTLVYTMQEVDPGDGSTAFGTQVSSTSITVIGTQRITLYSAFGGSILITWTIGGTSTPTFTQVYATVLAKPGSTIITDGGNLPVAVKAANTAVSATDNVLAIGISPTSYVSGEGQSGSYPQPTQVALATVPINVDSFGNVQIRGPVLTDEGSFHDPFLGSALTTALTGTATFVNGSTAVVGIGTAFTTQVQLDQYVKLTADSETAFAQVIVINSDTSLTLAANYTGSSTTGATVVTNWTTSTAAGGSITVASSVVSIVNALTNAATTYMFHSADYVPIQLTVIAAFTSGIANQKAFLGFMDVPSAPQQQCIIQWDGSLATNQLRFITSNSNASSETLTQTLTLPTGLLVTQTLSYKISLTIRGAGLEVAPVNTTDSTMIAWAEQHVPTPYTVMVVAAGLTNSAIIGSSATLALDSILINNQDRVEVANSFSTEPVKTLLSGKVALAGLVSTGLLGDVFTDGSGYLYSRTAQSPDMTILLNNVNLTASGSLIIQNVGRKEVCWVFNQQGAISGGSPSLVFSLSELDPVTLAYILTLPGSNISATFTGGPGNTFQKIISNSGALLATWTITGAGTAFANTSMSLLVKEQAAVPLASGRQRIAIVYEGVGALADTLLSMTEYLQGFANAPATSIPVTSGSYLRITSMVFSVKAGAAAAAYATFNVRINEFGTTVIGSHSEMRIDVPPTGAVSGEGSSVTVSIPDGIELNSADGASIGVSAACQAVTNVLSVTLFGFQYF